MNKYGLDEKRQTGRTTRMLKAACLAAKSGGRIAALLADSREAWSAFDICRSKGLADGARFDHTRLIAEFPNEGAVYFIPETMDPSRLQGVVFDATLTDHRVRELQVNRAEHMIAEAFGILKEAAGSA